MGIFAKTRDAFNRELSDDDIYDIAGTPLNCPHCGHRHFEYDMALLNTRAMSFVGLDWANANASLYICKNCGHIEWFVDC